MVKSKYKIPQLILTVSISALFFLLPFTIMNSGKPIKNEFLLLIMPALSLFLIYTTFQKSPRIAFDDEFITAKSLLNTKTYDWSSIRDIYLSRKESYLSQNLEATSIIFDNDEKILIWQDVYSNCGQIRKLLSVKAADKIRDPRPAWKPGNLMAITRRRYSGNVYTSFNTLLIVGISLFMAFSFLGKMSSEKLIFIPIIFICLLFLGLGTQMNYFLIDDGYLVIKNHYLAWINKKLSLQDIVEIDVEQPNKRSAGLRVMTNDFNSKFYGAGSLRDENWDQLLNDLKIIGIPSRNDR